MQNSKKCKIQFYVLLHFAVFNVSHLQHYFYLYIFLYVGIEYAFVPFEYFVVNAIIHFLQMMQ